MSIAIAMKDLAFWGKLRLGKPAKLRYYATLKANERLSRDELEELNWRKRKDMLRYAFDRVPFYRKKFLDVGLHPDDVRYPEDYAKVPITTKEDLRTHNSAFLAAGNRPGYLQQSTTGGSTGVPVTVMHDRRFHYEALIWRMLHWWNVSPGMNSAYILRQRRKRPVQRWLNAAMWFPTRRAHLDASLMTDETVAGFLRRLQATRPQLIQGYTGAVQHVALYMERHGIRIPAPRAVWVTSSPISVVQRSTIESAFNAPVYDQYGCGEVFALAAECPSRVGLHVFWDARFVEIVDERGRAAPPADHGGVVITDLENRVFPIIRYATGDVSRLMSCVCLCGRPFPLMEPVKGRVTDCVRLPDGSTISGDYLTTIFDDCPEAVEAFQILQQRDFTIVLSYVPAADPARTLRAVELVRRELEVRCRGLAPVHVRAQDEIRHDQGKLRFVISEVA